MADSSIRPIDDGGDTQRSLDSALFVTPLWRDACTVTNTITCSSSTSLRHRLLLQHDTPNCAAPLSSAVLVNGSIVGAGTIFQQGGQDQHFPAGGLGAL